MGLGIRAMNLFCDMRDRQEVWTSLYRCSDGGKPKGATVSSCTSDVRHAEVAIVRRERDCESIMDDQVSTAQIRTCELDQDCAMTVKRAESAERRVQELERTVIELMARNSAMAMAADRANRKVEDLEHTVAVLSSEERDAARAQVAALLDVDMLTEVVREADAVFQRVGGSTRHWVRDCFLPLIEKRLSAQPPQPDDGARERERAVVRAARDLSAFWHEGDLSEMYGQRLNEHAEAVVDAIDALDAASRAGGESE